MKTCDASFKALISIVIVITGLTIELGTHLDLTSFVAGVNDQGYSVMASPQTAIEIPADSVPAIYQGPVFDLETSRNVTALVGKIAQIYCRVHRLGNRTVSWIRHRDIHLLTSGVMTYTSDQRFSSVHYPQSDDWVLKIRFPQQRDSGVYECQVGTTPPMGHRMYLSVVEPITTVLGGPELYINTGSTINLTCVVKHSPEPPPNIMWTHNNEEINYDSSRGGVSVITEKGEVSTSHLLVQKAKPPDSGRYTCMPVNANPVSVLVHVLSGEHPAAMQHGGRLKMEYPGLVAVLSLIVYCAGY